MAKRDPEKTARNKRIIEISEVLNTIRPEVMRVSECTSEQSLHGKIGGKNAEFIDIRNEIIYTPDQYIGLWLQGFLKVLEERSSFGVDKSECRYHQLHRLIKYSEVFRKYTFLFLERTFWRNFEALSRRRPSIEESELWIGQTNANYGILVTPRFRNEKWENDKSEIRHFKHGYWTIAHILETGLVIPGKDNRILFHNIEEYLTFFINVLVRNTGSVHQMNLAERYCDYVINKSDNPYNVPLLIPELRYAGLERNHKYRLDFCIIDTYTLSKIGIELSPWSSHGYIKGTKGKKQKEINRLAREHFEYEITKQKEYLRKFGVFTLIYSDTDLANPDQIFNNILPYLNPEHNQIQLFKIIIDDFMAYE